MAHTTILFHPAISVSKFKHYSKLSTSSAHAPPGSARNVPYMWLMTEPVRKVLRQSTLVGAFQCQQKRTKIDEGYSSLLIEAQIGYSLPVLKLVLTISDVSSSTEVDCCSEMEPTDDRRRKCELAAQAADRRMGQSRASSQIVQDNPGSPLLFTE